VDIDRFAIETAEVQVGGALSREIELLRGLSRRSHDHEGRSAMAGDRQNAVDIVTHPDGTVRRFLREKFGQDQGAHR
jgi:hypothetical protein